MRESMVLVGAILIILGASLASTNYLIDTEVPIRLFEAIRAHGAVKMGLIGRADEAARRQHTPKVAFVAGPATYMASSGKEVAAADIDLLVRALSMGLLHHAMMGTAAVAIGTAAKTRSV